MRKLIATLLIALAAVTGTGLAFAATSSVAEKPSGSKVIDGDVVAPAGLPDEAVEYAASLTD